MTGLLRRPQLSGDLVVGGGQAGRGVDDPHDDVGLAHGLIGLQADIGQQVTTLVSRPIPPASMTVNSRSRHSAVPYRRSRVVPGNPVNDSPMLANQPG